MTGSNYVKLTTALVVGALLVPLLLLIAWGILYSLGTRDRTVRKELQSVRDWPGHVQEIHNALINHDPDLDMQGFLLRGTPGPYSVDVAAFRIINAKEGTFEALGSELQLAAIEPDHQLAGWGQTVVEGSSADWWVPPEVDSSYYASQHLLDGGEGPLYVVAYTPKNSTIYISYHFNF